MSGAKQVKSPEAGERLSQKDKERFFGRKSKAQEPISDLDHLRHWANRIQAWIDHVEGRLRKMEGLPIALQDAERDNVLVNPHVTRLYQPSMDELSALVHLGITFPLALQEVQGFLRNADAWYARLSEGPTAGENLMNALFELRDAILAAGKGIEASVDERTGKPNGKLPKHPPNELNKHVAALIKAGEKSPTKMAKILNKNYVGTYSPTSRKSIDGTDVYTKYKRQRKKNAR